MNGEGAPPPTAWVLNLDAEQELADPRGYTRSDAMDRQVRAAALRVVGLVSDRDVVLDTDTPPRCGGLVGDAWCPTPRALERLRHAGAVVPAAPAVEILQRVNDRAFAVGIDPGPLESRYASDLDAIGAHVAIIGDAGAVLKRALSFAGRGQRRVRGRLDADDVRWCEGALRGGRGVVVEPWVEREQDFVQHGRVGPRGAIALGRPLAQVVDDRGAWQRTVAEGDAGTMRLRDDERTSLLRAAERAGAALAAAGYFGPFGIDAFRYRVGARVAFNPMVELNARYGMGFGLSHCAREVR